MLTDTEKEFLFRMPKVNLHVHIEGSIAPDTLFEIATENGYINELSEIQIKRIKSDEFTYVDFPTFIDTYSMCANALRSQADYHRATYEYLKLAHDENIRYVEAYISPHSRMKNGVAFDAIIDGAFNGMQQAYEDFGILSDIVIDTGRHSMWTKAMNPDNARRESLDLVKLILEHQRKGIVGFSVGGKEDGYPLYPFADAFKLARDNGLHVKAHAGESISANDIWYAIGLLGAERIGHAVHASDDPQLMKYMANNNIAIEVCPTGNVFTGVVASLEQHPIKTFLEHDVPVTIGNDDPELFGINLTDEYQKVMETFQMSVDDIQILVMKSLDILWCDDAHKATLSEQFQVSFQSLREELDL